MRALRVLLNLSGLIIDGRSRPEAETAATRKRSCAALASGHWHRGQCRGSTARADGFDSQDGTSGIALQCIVETSQPDGRGDGLICGVNTIRDADRLL